MFHWKRFMPALMSTSIVLTTCVPWQELQLAGAHVRVRPDVDRRAALRVLALEIAIGGAALRLRIVLPLHGRTRIEQRHVRSCRAPSSARAA